MDYRVSGIFRRVFLCRDGDRLSWTSDATTYRFRVSEISGVSGKHEYSLISVYVWIRGVQVHVVSWSDVYPDMKDVLDALDELISKPTENPQ
jgi:hypothetical protein